MTEEERQSTPEEIALAEQQGWRDNPDHPNYKPAWKFVDDGEKIAPIQAERNHKLTAEIAGLKETMEEMRKSFFEQRAAGQREGYERAKKELEKRKAKAYEDEDVDELKRIDMEERQLAPPKIEEPAPIKKVNTDFLEWRENNKWYGDQTNPDHVEMSLYADSLGPMIAGQYPEGTPLTTIYKEVENRVKKRFPESFGEQGGQQRAASVEDASQRPSRKTGKQDWRSLPKEIREEAEKNKTVSRYFGNDKEAYAKHYYQVFQEA